MTALWTIFEILINIYQGFILTITVCRCLGSKSEKGYFQSLGPAFGLILAVCITAETFLIPFEYFYILLYVVILLAYSLLCLNGSLLDKIIFSILPIIITCLSSALCINGAIVVFQDDFERIISTPCWERFFTVIITNLVALYLFEILVKLRKKNNESDYLKIYEWAFIFMVLIVSVIIAAYILASNSDNFEHKGLYSVIVLAAILLVNIIVCYLTVDFGKKNRAIGENKLLKMTQEYSQQYINNVNSEFDAMRKLRHDCKNSFLAIYSLLENGEINKAKEQLTANLDAIADTEIFINTNNSVVNAIVNNKLSAAKTFGIVSSCMSPSDINGIDDMDLCRLLSNMLDNAITACQNDASDKKQIELRIVENEGRYIFSLKNTISQSVIEKNPSLISTKKNKANHGLGVRIIKEIAEKYDGYSDFYEERGMFCCMAVLRKNNL